VLRKLSAGKHRNLNEPFFWTKIIESQAPALLFRDACNDVSGCKGYERLPDSPNHFYDMVRAQNIPAAVAECAVEEIEAGRFCPVDQVSVDLPLYYPKLKFPSHEAYVYKSEYWLQPGNRESPVHVDHGRVVSYIPPCAKYCFKV
ncbi:hypothetical protein F441_12978, partial [Phytophthora nicotianae CJ01A1]